MSRVAFTRFFLRYNHQMAQTLEVLYKIVRQGGKRVCIYLDTPCNISSHGAVQQLENYQVAMPRKVIHLEDQWTSGRDTSSGQPLWSLTEPGSWRPSASPEITLRTYRAPSSSLRLLQRRALTRPVENVRRPTLRLGGVSPLIGCTKIILRQHQESHSR